MILRSILYILIASFVASCNKDKVQTTVVVEPTKWELISGDYKVYDTLGAFLYDMSISHKKNEPLNEDSLMFENFDGEFTFTVKQDDFTNYPLYLTLGFHDTICDSQSNRWRLMAGLSEDYNQLIDDTIKLRFTRTNINFWFEDVVPYFTCDCKQIAIKQH